MSSGKLNKGDTQVTMARSRNIYHYVVRKARRQSALLKARNLREASLASDIELLKEMKKVRCEGGGQAELPDKVAGAEGKSAIVEKSIVIFTALEQLRLGW